MPEDSRKNQQKGKNDPKDQRRRRQGRQPVGPVEKKPEKQPEPPKEQEKPAYEPPGPEFYKNLKRETDEILKITEEANTKYKKKEIQSNWAKYEMPVESYEDIDEQENMGADYEKLIQASVSTGGHFQFKHEKSWDTDTGPSLYDKYFDINMDLLSLAISTIPFYERNKIDESVFNENDIVTMNHRATKFKQKYYNDKKYNTPELEAQDKILKSLASDSDIPQDDASKKIPEIDFTTEKPFNNKNKIHEKCEEEEKVELKKEVVPIISSPIKQTQDSKQVDEIITKPDINKTIKSSPVKEINEIMSTLDVNKITESNIDLKEDKMFFAFEEKQQNEVVSKEPEIAFTKVEPPKHTEIVEKVKPTVAEVPPPKNPVIQSPEDLEKWLDDFLDG